MNRKQVLDLTIEFGEGHLGGAFSCIEIINVLYDKVLTKDDKFIMSKGHAWYPLYLKLKEKGLNPTLSGHPDIDIENGIECTIGSLGHGLPIGVGMAMAKKFKKEPGRIFVLMSDGECQEGTTWECALIAAHHKLRNLTVIVDYNNMQSLDWIHNINDLYSLVEKFSAFGWEAEQTNGHDVEELEIEFEYHPFDFPYIVIAKTIKGKGVSYMENNPKWHARLPTKKEYEQACEELSESG